MKILVFGDNLGIPFLIRYIPSENIVGVVGAVIRPQYFDLLEDITKKHNVPFFIQPLPKNRADYEKFLCSIKLLAPDLIFVNSYSMILREDLLRIPRMGALNIHRALLPEYRGCNPSQWAIINMEHKTGVTLHQITPGIDEGPIVARKEIEIDFEDTWVDVGKKNWQVTGQIVEEQLPNILNENLRSYPQEESRANYWKRRKPSDGFFDWDQPIVEIYNLIRALVAPLPGAYFLLDDKKIVLDEFIPLNELFVKKQKYIQKWEGEIGSHFTFHNVGSESRNEVSFFVKIEDKSFSFKLELEQNYLESRGIKIVIESSCDELIAQGFLKDISCLFIRELKPEFISFYKQDKGQEIEILRTKGELES